MSTASTAPMQMAAPSGLLSLMLFLVAMALLALLAGSFWLGSRVRFREPPRPRPEEQPHLPPGGAVHEVLESREPEEVPKVSKGEHALTPYELSNMQTRSGPPKKRPRWGGHSSGAFGSGGLGSH